MSRKMLIALLILGLVAIILVFNTMGSDREIEIDLLVAQIKVIKSLAFLAFIAIGVVIGVLLK